LLEIFAERLREAGGTVSIHRELDEAVTYALRKLGSGSIIGVKVPENIAGMLERRCVQLLGMDAHRLLDRSRLIEAEASIGFADAGVAETGSILYLTRTVDEEAAIFSPETHITILNSNLILPTLEDLSDKLYTALSTGLSAYLITGPSSTGDIEGEIVVGAHGSRFLHVAIYGGDE